MSANTSFILTLLFCVLLLFAAFYFYPKISKGWRNNLKTDWFDFKIAVEKNQHSKIIEIGETLCQNYYITKEQVEFIEDIYNKNKLISSEYKRLELAIMNKKLRWQSNESSWF